MPPTRHIQTLFLTLLLFLFALPLAAQNISVQSFDLLERDLDARVHNRVNDQNGELCALIKVVTPHTGFEWEPDALGIVESIRKTGEYWLYVPRGARRITIKHDNLGILRNYEYPIAIRSGDVYEMVLTTADIQVIVTDPVVESQWLAITTEPKGADVYINDQLAGNTEQDFSRRYPEGEYTYRIEMRGYHTEAGVVPLRGDREVLHFDLRPNFGNVYVTSEPESGMTIFLNGNDTGETTPATLHGISSGRHDIRLVSRWYQPKVQTITVEDNETTNVSFVMSPAFAEITIQTEPVAAIYIDDNRVAQGMHTARLMTGVYDIAARLDKHHEDKRQLHVVAGVSQEINLSPEAKTGSLDVTSSPIGAGIRLTDVATGRVTEHGTTPTTLRNLLIGDYEVELSRSGHATLSERVTISEGETAEVNMELPAGMEVTITSEPAGADVYIDDRRVGVTPYTGELGFGSHRVRLVNRSRTVEETIQVRQGGRSNFNFDVREGMQVTITSSPTGAELFINNQRVGNTPYTSELTFGSHRIRLVNRSRTVEETIEIRQGGRSSFSFEVTDCGTEVTFTYRGSRVTYGVIERGGLCWMDRNLGASRVPTSSTDAQGYGDLFQWVRGDDGHQVRASGTTSRLSRRDAPRHDNFITVSDSPRDWRSSRNNDLWQGERGINNPCPEGWRVPTISELNSERQSWGSNNSDGAYASALKWPVGGNRHYNGSLYFVGSYGHVWSSSVGGTNARSLLFNSGNAGMSSDFRAYGMSVRCVREP